MRQLDAYDPRAAFDDLEVIKTFNCASPESCAEAARAIMLCAIRRRQNMPVPILYDFDHDTTVATFEVPSSRPTVVGEIPGLSLFSKLRQKFFATVPPPKQVRVDDAKTYYDFRQARRQPYHASLEAMITDGIVRRELADSVDAAVALVEQGGEKIDLPFEEVESGSIECWLDGPEILCSVHLRRSDGSACIATAGESCMHALEELVSCAMEEDVEPEEVIGIASHTAKVLGATALIGQVCAAARSLVRQPAPYVGVLESSCDPNVAAMMALIQQCWRGDRWACVEVFRLERACPTLVDYAKDCLQKARASS